MLKHGIYILILVAAAVAVAAWDSSANPACTLINKMKAVSEQAQTQELPINKCATFFIRIGESTLKRVRNYKDEINAVSTFVIAIFTVVLGIFTIGLAKSTRIAADAARDAAKAAIAINLPIIRVQPDGLALGDSTDASGVISHSCSVFGAVFSNLGRDKAFPIEVRCGISLRQLPTEPTYSTAETFLPNLIFEPDLKITPRKNFANCIANISLEERTALSGFNSKIPLWFYCCVVYDDFMQNRHEAGFCWKWSHLGMGMGWRADPTPAYNRKT